MAWEGPTPTSLLFPKVSRTFQNNVTSWVQINSVFQMLSQYLTRVFLHSLRRNSGAVLQHVLFPLHLVDNSDFPLMVCRPHYFESCGNTTVEVCGGTNLLTLWPKTNKKWKKQGSERYWQSVVCNEPFSVPHPTPK